MGRRRDHPRVWLAAAVLLGLFTLYTCSVVIRGLTLATERSRLGHVHWAAVPVFLVIIIVSGWFTLRFWRSWRATRQPESG